MVRVWKIGAWPGVEDSKEDYIKKALDENFVAVGGARMPNLSELSFEEIRDRMNNKQKTSEWYRFGHEIRQGHIILLYDNHSERKQAYVGRVEPPRDLKGPNSRADEAYYRVPKNHRLAHFFKGPDYAPHRVNVKWLHNKKSEKVLIDWEDTLHEVTADKIWTKKRPKEQTGRPQGVWLHSNPRFAAELQKLLQVDNTGPYIPTGERQSLTTHRIGQGKIRDRALERYDDQCALCAINLPSLLIAGHIQGWASNEKARNQDSNVILMCSLHDSLFGRGLFTLIPHNGSYKVKVSRLLELPAYSEWFPLIGDCIFRKISVGPPGASYLKWHRENVFLSKIQV